MRRAPRVTSVDIDRLVVDGIPLGQGGADHLKRAVIDAVAAQLAAGGVAIELSRRGRERTLVAAPITVPREATTTPAGAAALGRLIGGAIASGLGERGSRR